MNFYVDVLRRDPRFRSPLACYDPALLHPEFRTVVAAILSDARTLGHTLHIGETFRSQARQALLFSKGLTKLRSVGVHGYGLACDFSLIRDGEYDADGSHYTFLVELCAKHPCPWGPTISGCDWGAPDSPHDWRDYDHVQAVRVEDQARLFSGEWYPR